MKRIDKDMFIIIISCLVFSLFLIPIDKVNGSSDYLGIVIKEKENKNITIYRKDKEISLPINDYLIGVVGCEVDATYETEALKTQAIVARTYALRKISKNDKLTDDVSTQCYKDNNELREKWGNNYNEYYDRIKKAVADTDNLAIYYNNELIDAVYHSLSNGYTEDAKEVWSSDIPYLTSVDSYWDKGNKKYKNIVSKDLDDFLSILGVSNSNYSIISRDKTGRIKEIMIGNKLFTGIEIRKLLGLKSTDFKLDIDNDKIDITTYGYGHGVGLSQEGSNYMAKQGYKYIDIIKHYYTGVEVKELKQT